MRENSDLIVSKFGGAGMANASQISKVESIIKEDERRKVVVVSAPGRDANFNYKVTDLLYNLYVSVNKRQRENITNYEPIEGFATDFQDMIVQRYSSISNDLKISKKVIEELKEAISIKNVAEKPLDQIVYLGEYFSAKLLAGYMRFGFVDAAGIIKMRKDGTVIMDTTLSNIKDITNLNQKIVIPGFYGSLVASNDIVTFSRGGSDFTGSIVAAGADAMLYENWTDRDGISACYPRLFEKNELEQKGKELFIIPKMSYKETRELTYMGFEVFNDESIGPLVQKNIPLVIKNVNNPFAPGTFISKEYDESRAVRGIAGKNGFCAVVVEKYLMNKTVGFGSNLLSILSEYGLNFEHAPSGIDSISVVLEQKPFERYKRDVLGDINRKLSPDSITVKEHLGLVAVVGERMKNNGLIFSEIMRSLASENIGTEIISQGASENNLILGINAQDYKRAIKTLYGALIENKV